jgi:hypothetical protein
MSSLPLLGRLSELGTEKREQLARAGEGLAATAADVLDHAAQLVLAGFCAAFGSGWDLDHERLHRLVCELDT